VKRHFPAASLLTIAATLVFVADEHAINWPLSFRHDLVFVVVVALVTFPLEVVMTLWLDVWVAAV